MKKIFFLLITLTAGLISCNREEPIDASKVGGLSFKVTNDTDYLLVTKTATDYGDINTYDVVIDGPTKVSKKYSELTGRVVELGSGHYTLTITSPNTLPAAFNQPIYSAKAEFDIRAGEVTSLDLVCKPANTMVTIELSDNFKKELATYEVVINNGLGELVWTKDLTKDDFAANLVGYFLPRGLEVKVKGYRSVDNTVATAVYYVENPKAAEHHIIKLDAKVTGQINSITISFETKFNEVSNDIHMDGLEESYVDRPDFEGSEDEGEGEVVLKNEIIWAENSLFEPYTISPDSQISMTIKMPAGIKTFVVEVDHADFQNAITLFTGDLDGDGNPEKYIDLIYDTTFAEKIAAVDTEGYLPLGDEVLGQTEVVFDLTCFVPLLCQSAPGQSVPFILKATDNNHNELLFMEDYPTITMVIPN